MSESRNKHRLPRRIPDDVKRLVRQASFFGCVVCGRLPYTYEHFDPPFHQAKAHDPVGMALLCSICQQDRTAGRLDLETVQKAHSSPHNQDRDGRYLTHFHGDQLRLKIGNDGIDCFGPKPGVYVNGDPLIALEVSQIPGDALNISGTFSDPDRRASIALNRNEIVVSRGVWDCTLEGQALTVRSSPGEIVARLLLQPPGEIIVERLKMGLGGGHRIEVDEYGLNLFRPGAAEPHRHFGGAPGMRGTRMGGEMTIVDPVYGRARDWIGGGTV